MTLRSSDPACFTGGIALTPRAWFFLISGLPLIALGFWRGWPPLAACGTLLLLLPSFSALGLRLFRTRVAVRRGLSAGVVSVGDQAQIRLGLTATAAGAPVLLIDSLPPQLGGARTLVLHPRAREELRAGYVVSATTRGRFQVGPLRIEQADLLGLAGSARTIEGRSELVVTPRVVPLPGGPLRGLAKAGKSGHGSPGGGHQDDVIPRPYLAGDELRRVDWRATARAGALMVRSAEQPWNSTMLIVVDLAGASHRGRAPDSSSEAALTLIASVGVLALREGWQLRVVTTDLRKIFAGGSRLDFLTALADVVTGEPQWPNPQLGRWEVGPVLLVIGDVSESVAAELAVSAPGGDRRMAVVVRSRQWETGPAHDSPAHAESILAAAGWTVAPFRRGDPPAAVWQRLAVQP